MTTLRWKKNARETGLRAIVQGPLGSVYHDGKTKFASVSAHSTRHTGITGWYWYAGSQGGIPFYNSSTDKPLTQAEAKAAAAAYVKKHIGSMK